MMVNHTNNCVLDVQEQWFFGSSITGITCNEDEGAQYNGTLYHAEYCSNKRTKQPGNVQVRQIESVYRIYCNGYRIEIQDIDYECPEFVFDVSLVETFTINGFTHRQIADKRVKIDTMESHVNRQIQEYLRINDHKFYSMNLTEFDSAVAKLGRVYGDFKEGAQIKLKKVPALFSSPFQAVNVLLNSILKIVEDGVIILIIVGIGVLLAIAVPILEVFLGAIGWIKRAITGVMVKLRRMFGFVKPIKKYRRPRYGLVYDEEDAHGY